MVIVILLVATITKIIHKSISNNIVMSEYPQVTQIRIRSTFINRYQELSVC